MTIGEGNEAPRFTLPDHRGQAVDVPAAGKPNVLIFYRGDW